MNKPRIYVLSTDTNVPCGGIKQLYRHVDILNDHGFDASIIHSEKNFRCTWFKNNTPISCLAKTQIEKSDYLVVPEILGELFSEAKADGGLNRRLKEFISLSKNTVIFNQNCYLSFNGYSITDSDVNPFWLSKSLIAAIVVSEDSRQYMNYVFPNIETFRIHNSVDSTLFSYQDEKKKQICFMPRKLRNDVSQVVNILKYRDALGDFKLIPIENKTEREVAQIMKESFMFLSFSYQEGCALPPIEAMMCGCLVIGYDGRGGREYFSRHVSFPIEGCNIIEFEKAVEDVIRHHNQNPAVFDEKRKKASEYVRTLYSPEVEREDIVQCWKQITAQSCTHG
jgi:hypothetical protein